MAENTLNEAAVSLIRTFNATQRSLTNSFIIAQQRNMRFAQAVFENSLTVIQSHVEATYTLAEEIVTQSDSPPALAECIIDSSFAAHERNMRLAQSIFNDSIEVLKDDAQDTQTLMHELIAQGQQQQEHVQSFALELTHAYIDFLRMPLAYYRQTMDKATSTT
jgi:hypothetical protein